MPLDKDDEKKLDARFADFDKKLDERLEEKLGEFKTSFNDGMNKAISTHVTRATKGLTESISAAVAEKLKSSEDEPPDDKKGKGEKGTDPEVKKQLDAMQKRLDTSEKARLDAESKQAATEQKRLKTEEREAARTILAKAGLDEPRVKAALAILHTEEGRIARAEDGKIVWKNGDDEVDLGKGLGEWLKSDEGKTFVPARDVRGSGGGGGGGKGPDGKDKRYDDGSFAADIQKAVLGI